MYCIMRTEKRKKSDVSGIQQENNRTAGNYNNRVELGMDIFNQQLVYSENWMRDIENEIQTAGARARSNSVVALDTIYTASPEFFQGRTNEENDDYFKACLQFHNNHFGHVVSAVIHYDESTPHMHVISVPLTKDGRLSARDIVGNKQQMSRTQDAFFNSVGRQYGLERGAQMDGQEKRKHISAQEWELQQLQAQKNKELIELTKIKNSRECVQKQVKITQERLKELKAEEKEYSFNVMNIQNEYEVIKDNLQNIQNQYRHLQKQVNEVKNFLGIAEKRRLAEIYRRQEEEHEL